MLNDIYWYNEKDGGYLKCTCIGGSDLLNCPSEDKYITTSEADRNCKKSSVLNSATEGFHSMTTINYLDKPCLLNNTSMDDRIPIADCYQWVEITQPEQGDEARPDGCSGKYNLDPLCDCCMGIKGYNGWKLEDHNQIKSLKETCSSDVQLKHVYECPSDCDSSSERKRSGGANWSIKSVDVDLQNDSHLHLQVSDEIVQLNGDNDHEIGDCRKMVGEHHESGTAVDGDECITPSDHPMYGSCEDDYEIFDLRIMHRKNRTGFEENKDLPIVLNTIIAGRYYLTEYLGSAAFSKVVQAYDLHTGMNICLKIIKNDKDFFDQSLDEIKLLKFVNKHDPIDEHHILRLYDYFYHQEHLFIVCELLQANLYEFQKFNQDSGGEPYFTLHRIQIITRQCLEALEYLHHLGIIHCDLKPENILIKSYSRCEIKIIDLGSSCFLTDNLCLYVQSRSYRAPEVILGLPYDQKIDIWSLGCVLAELCSGDVLFPNDALVMLLARMIEMLGPIDMEMLERGQETHKYFTEEYDLYYINEETNQLEYIIPEQSSLEHHLQVSDAGFVEFIRDLLEINPEKRLSAKDALQHPWLSYSYE
ncbi:PREDICTED: serine/threonine-protein kinase ppk15-like isoform X2 [Nelumbo nucifera]|nr:PREDICTED: serine/threonine-protein kinase ppk15-like isoform X2 [Nelumbo nucifera]